MSSPEEIAEAWRKFLLEGEATENYWRPYLMYVVQAHRDAFLEQFLPGLLYIKAVAILDHALDTLIAVKGLKMPRRYRDSLEGRIDFLADQGALSERDRVHLHRIRRRRNELAHQGGAIASWAEMKEDRERIHEALQAQGLVDGPKALEFFYRRSGIRDSTRAPEFRWERDLEYRVKEDATEVLTVKWTQHLGGLGG